MIDNPRNIEELKEKYIRARRGRVPMRQKGKYYQSIQVPFLILGVFLLFVESAISFMTGFVNKEFWMVVGVFTIYVCAYWPEEIYHDQKRWPRIVLPKFPKLKPVIESLVKPDTGEVCTLHMPILEINGENYFSEIFLVRQKWWQIKIKVDLKGSVLLNSEGEIIQSTDLMLLSYFVFANACTGSVNIQKKDWGVSQNIKDTRRWYLPLARWVLSMQKWQFEKAGIADQWQELMYGMDIQRRALAEAMEIYTDKDQVRKAIGYSYGSLYHLEDARIEEEIYRSFGNYMREAYRTDLNNLNMVVKYISDRLRKEYFWLFKWFTRKAISTINLANTLIMIPVVEADWYGVPREWEWKAYVDRLKYARELGLPIVEIGEFSEEYPVDRIKELFPDYHWD